MHQVEAPVLQDFGEQPEELGLEGVPQGLRAPEEEGEEVEHEDAQEA